MLLSGIGKRHYKEYVFCVIMVNKGMTIIDEKIIDIGIALGLDGAKAIAQERERVRDYEKTVLDILGHHSVEFEGAGFDEEIDLEGFINFLGTSRTTEQMRTALCGTYAERKRSRAALYDMAYLYADARTSKAKGQIRKIISAVIESLRTLERAKVSQEIRCVLEDSVDEINEHADENTRKLQSEIHQVGEAVKRLLAENEVKKQYDSLYEAMLDNGGEEIGDGVIRFNLNKADRKLLSYANDDEIQMMRKQLGSRLKGNEDREDVITLFWAETRMTMQSGRRYQVMPLFQNYVRDECMASILTDGIPIIVDRVHLAHFYWDDYDVLYLQGELYWLRILICKDEPIAISMAYNFGHLNDVNERMFYFDKIKPIVFAKEIIITGTGESEYNVRFDLRKIGKEWNDHVELTQYWIEQMKKLVEIENYFGVHFNLPNKATERDYISIEILCDSIHRRNCRTLPGIPENELRETGREEVIAFDKEYPLVCPDCLEKIELFGYIFKPVMEYMIPCELRWNEDHACFETEDGGIPTGVEFAVLR